MSVLPAPALPRFALTLIRPWEIAIVQGPKRVENRAWHAGSMVSKRFFIHAGQKYDVGAAEFIEHRWPDHPVLAAVSRPGRIVGSACIARCVQKDGSYDPREPWAFGPWIWHLTGVLAYENPVPCNGRQKFWEPDDATRRACETEEIRAFDRHVRGLR